MKLKVHIFFAYLAAVFFSASLSWALGKKVVLLEDNSSNLNTAPKSSIDLKKNSVSVQNFKAHGEKISLYFNNTNEEISFQNFLKENANLEEAFKNYNLPQQKVKAAQEALSRWSPKNEHFVTYKEYFLALWGEQYLELEKIYLKLQKEKKFIRLRFEILSLFLTTPADKLKIENGQDFIIKEARVLLKQLRGTSEGEIFEAKYLKYLQKNKLFTEICLAERARWLSEPTLDFVEVTAATQQCSMTLDDFITRLRRLLFAAKDYQALREIELFAQYANLKDYEKAYIKAIFDSNSGDPINAFKSLVPFEKELLDTEYNDNYFYIAQRAGELDKAEAIISKILQKPQIKNYKELKFQQGFLFYQTKKYKQAYKIFDQLYEQHPQKKKKRFSRASKEFDQLAWLRAWTLYLDGQYKEALAAFEATTAFALDEARLAYWISDVKYKLNDEGSAFAGFRRLASPVLEQKPFSFYNFLAWLRFEEIKKSYKTNDILKNLALVAKLNKAPFPVASDALSYSQVRATYSFFDREQFETDEGALALANNENEVIQNTDTFGVDVKTEAELELQLNWARFLISQGEADLARWHLYEVEKKINTRKKAETLAQFYKSQQFYYRSLSLMNRFSLTGNNQLSLSSDATLWTSLYPEAYKQSVFNFAEKAQVDPYLILSIMRAETQYKSDAISPVGAVGLMQFMPYSAQKVSDLLDQKIQTDELFKPEKSIEFGAFYLKKLSLEMSDLKPLVAASYNGGPHRVKAWLKNLGTMEFDRFIEHIPFSETRTYVKRVTTYRAIYDKLYNGQIAFQKYNYLVNPMTIKAKDSFSLKEEWEPYKSEIKNLNKIN